MPQLSFDASGLVSLFHTIAKSMLALLVSSWDGPPGKYRPEDHYMRGPGPKWREKHFPDKVSARGT